MAFTAAQIPGIDDRVSRLAGGAALPGRDSRSCPSRAASLVRSEEADEVVLAYSDLSHQAVMHKASIALAAGADWAAQAGRDDAARHEAGRRGLRRPRRQRQEPNRPPGRRALRRRAQGGPLVRHPMPYGDLERMRVQRFATLADIDDSDPTVSEGARSTSSRSRNRDGDVRGRRLRRDPRAGPGRGRRDHPGPTMAAASRSSAPTS